MKTFIHNSKIFLDQHAFLKALAKKSKKEHALLLSKITKFKQDIDSEEKFHEHDKTKNELEIYDNIAEGVKIRSKMFLVSIR